MYVIIVLLGLLIAYYDLRFREIPGVLLVTHLVFIIVFISKLSITFGIILGLMVTISFLICFVNKKPIDLTYVILIICLIFFLKSLHLFVSYMILPFIIMAIIIFLSNKKDFPYIVCLSILTTYLLYFLL
jgi:hypothetical protein